VLKVWWIEQKYVVPVVADSLEEAQDIAFNARKTIAQECGGIERQYRPLRVGLFDGTRDGWENCIPYGKSETKTLTELEAEGIK